MAILNGLYIHVVSENMTRRVDATSHPVEDGIPFTDTVRPNARTLSLDGKIVDYGDMTAPQVIAQIRTWMENGTLLLYQGRNVASSMQIRSFDTDHPNTNNGGADFYLLLEQVRIAKSAYVPKKTSTTQQSAAAKGDVAKLAVGDKCVFKGGPVYVASDATRATSTRSRSTCKITLISRESWSVHQYHLVSEDGGMVYGWVDASNLECIPAPTTSGKTNAGTQQTTTKKTATSTKTNVTKKTNTVKTNTPRAPVKNTTVMLN